MTDKERLEDIKNNIKEIRETPYGIRHIKAKEVGIDLVMTGKVDFLLQEIDSINEQNKRYREIFQKILDSTMTIKDYKTHSYYVERLTRKALKKEE